MKTQKQEIMEYARQRRDNAYLLYSIHRNGELANAQYYMGKWHEALDHYRYLEKIVGLVPSKQEENA